MKTVLISDVINDFKMLPPNSLPDHSILSGKFITSYFELGRNFEQQNASNINTSTQCSNKPPRKNLTKIDENFLMSRETLELVLATISRLQTTVDTKEEINRLWIEVKEIFITEMNKLPDIPRSSSKKLNRKFRKSKPFWNQELEQLWSCSCQAEKSYLHFKVQTNTDFPIKNILRLEFKGKQQHFDKKFRYYKRLHKKQEYTNLETSAKTDPAAMWSALKRLNNPQSPKLL